MPRGDAATNAQGVSFRNVYGVILEAGATNILIGGTDPGAGNVISNSGVTGISIWGIGTNYNTVEGNKIGTDVSGAMPLPNDYGVAIKSGPANNTIGGILT